MKDNLIITIGRQYGSGGREIGKKLAEKLGIPFYDRELIQRAAKKTGVSEDMFHQLDQRGTNSLLYSLAMFGGTGMNGMSLSDQLYLAQTNVIRDIASHGAAVIVGRCSDYVLSECENKIDFFITGDIDSRLQRISIGGNGYEPLQGRNPRTALEKMDKQRATYYNYYTGRNWGKGENYDLSINASHLGVDATVDLLFHYIELREQL